MKETNYHNVGNNHIWTYGVELCPTSKAKGDSWKFYATGAPAAGTTGPDKSHRNHENVNEILSCWTYDSQSISKSSLQNTR